MNIPEQLQAVSHQVKNGSAHAETVRTLLSWFNQQRRGFKVVNAIREALAHVQLKTEPDFELAYFDGPIQFLHAKGAEVEVILPEDKGPHSMPKMSEARFGAIKDPVARVSILSAANNDNLCCVTRDTNIAEAVMYVNIGSDPSRVALDNLVPHVGPHSE